MNKFVFHVKKKRTISIKNPKLRKIRNSLREIISQAQTMEIKKIQEESSKIIEKFKVDQETEEMTQFREITGEFSFWMGDYTENFKNWLKERNIDLGTVEMNHKKKIEQFEANPVNKELNEIEIKLSDKRDKLDYAWSNSICICPVCGSRTSDMTFNPYLKAWFCVDCYEKNRDFYVRRGEPHIYP